MQRYYQHTENSWMKIVNGRRQLDAENIILVADDSCSLPAMEPSEANSSNSLSISTIPQGRRGLSGFRIKTFLFSLYS